MGGASSVGDLQPMNYDVFLSHSHVDKAWTRQLYDRLATTDYNGRRLRAWLDQEVLDPGNLSSSRELESALDRSRFLAVVLTPESVASHWVRHEIDYFVGSKQPESTAVIRRRACKIPQALADAEMIEWIDKDDDQESSTGRQDRSSVNNELAVRGRAVRLEAGRDRSVANRSFDNGDNTPQPGTGSGSSGPRDQSRCDGRSHIRQVSRHGTC